jgi:hypothetical protein
MKIKLIILIIISLLYSCSGNNSTNNKLEEKLVDEIHINEAEVKEVNTVSTDSSSINQHPRFELNPLEFVNKLKGGEKLSSFFENNWTLIYHEDNRCDGSTDGQKDNLLSTQIDTTIKLQVTNDGDGWACDKKEPESFNLDFNLNKLITLWDRFEITNNKEENTIYIMGAGESDYLKLHYNNSNLIVKLEYRSEDPG